MFARISTSNCAQNVLILKLNEQKMSEIPDKRCHIINAVNERKMLTEEGKFKKNVALKCNTKDMRRKN